MKQRKNISFDFDHTLSKPEVQLMARACVLAGHNVFVTTARWPDPLTHMWSEGDSNEAVYEVLRSIGIPITKVIYTHTNMKASSLIQARTDIHLDDNPDQLFYATLAGVKCVDVTKDGWADVFTKLLKAPVYDLKILICGEGRHGKDTMAELLEEYVGLTATSSSWVAAELFYNEYRGVYGYTSIEQCYEDRVNHRKEWYDFITKYNSPDRTKLTKKILETSNIYVGLRNPEEFEQAKDLFDITVWVDASKRLPGEGKESNGITPDMCDIILENNGTLEEFKSKVKAFSKILNLKR